MLSRDVEIIDIDPEQYERVARLIPGMPRRQGLFLFYTGNRLLRAVHSRLGPLDGVAFHGPERLDALAREHGADYVVCVERGALNRIAADAQAAVRFEDPLSPQGLAFYNALRNELGAGLNIFPDPLQKPPRVPARLKQLSRAFFAHDLLALFVVFDDNGVWASLIMEIRNREIVFLSTTDHLEPLELEGLGQEAMAQHILNRLRERRGRADLALFCDGAAFRHIIRHPAPAAALLRLDRLGWVRLNPCPPGFRALLGPASKLEIS
jgi:hypothetical protein